MWVRHARAHYASHPVQGLQNDTSRTFSYVEQAFFQRWFEVQSNGMQSTVKGLVASGQLTFLNGGWR